MRFVSQIYVWFFGYYLNIKIWINLQKKIANLSLLFKLDQFKLVELFNLNAHQRD